MRRSGFIGTFPADLNSGPFTLDEALDPISPWMAYTGTYNVASATISTDAVQPENILWLNDSLFLHGSKNAANTNSRPSFQLASIGEDGTGAVEENEAAAADSGAGDIILTPMGSGFLVIQDVGSNTVATSLGDGGASGIFDYGTRASTVMSSIVQPYAAAPYTGLISSVYYIESGTIKEKQVSEASSNYTVGSASNLYTTETAVAMRSAMLLKNKVLFAWIDSSGNLKTGIISYSGTTPTANTKVTAATGAYTTAFRKRLIEICVLDHQTALIYFRDSGDNLAVVPVTISGTTITAGTKQVIGSGDMADGGLSFHAVVVDPANKVAMSAYMRSSDNYVVTQCLRYVNKDTLKLAPEVVTLAAAANQITLAKNPFRNYAMLLYGDGDFKARILKPL